MSHGGRLTGIGDPTPAVLTPAMLTPTMLIDGEQTTAHQTFDVRNPATGAVVGRAPSCSLDQLDVAMDAAERAFDSWRLDEEARCAKLLEAAEALKLAVEELAPVLTAEQGKPLKQAREEIRAASAWFKYFGNLHLRDEVIQDDDRAFVEVVRCPIGTVAAITPWNYPVLLAAWKIAPALRMGNTVVVKPSPYTPLSTLLIGELLATLLPRGVVNVISGPEPLGAAVAAHVVPRKLSFTGSVATGKAVASAASATLARLTLELGGNDAAVVLDDVDIASVVESLYWGAFTNSGQVCAAIKRLLVPATRHDEFVDALAARADATVVDDGMLQGTEMGPLTTELQLARVESLVGEARAAGAAVAAGGRKVDRPGNFFPPTIVANARSGMAIVDEEQFGPALPVIAYRDEADALALANATEFGLGGSVWSADPARAGALARQLRCGTAWVNCHTVLAPNQPFGGLGQSGLGVENGRWGLEGFSELRVVHHSRRALVD